MAELSALRRAWQQAPAPLDWFTYGPVMLTRNLPGRASDESMIRFLDELEEASERQLELIFSLASGTVILAADKRKRLGSIMRHYKLPAIVVSDDRMTRGAVTALSWLGAPVRSFSWKRTNEAVAAARMPDEITDVIREFIEVFRPMTVDSSAAPPDEA